MIYFLQYISKRHCSAVSSQTKFNTIPIQIFTFIFSLNRKTGYRRLQDYVQKPDAWDAVKTFANMHKCNVVVLIGMKQLENGRLRRDLAVVQLEDAAIGQKLLQKLLNSKNPDLELKTVHVATKGFDKIDLFEQLNVRASRKQILPLAKQILDENMRS